MNDYASLRKKNNSSLAMVILLLVCVVLTATLLFGRLMGYTTTERIQKIPLTQSNGITRVTTSEPLSAARRPSGLLAVPAVTPLSTTVLASPGFEARDENIVWSGETDIEIFSITYDNESGQTTVRSQNDMKVLAPGVGSKYTFELENTGNVSLDYTMEMDAWFSHTDYPIPVVVRVSDSIGNYYLGSDEEMVDVLRLSEVKAAGTIAKDWLRAYTLEWEWPYERGEDIYDTMLGNMAVDEDITLTIRIRTTATYSGDPDAPGGDRPATGDNAQIGLYAILMVASLGGLLFLLLPRGKEETNEVP